MEKTFSRNWKRSVQPRKQRKYRYNATLNIRNKFMSSHLSKELRLKYGRRNITVRKGDKVKVMRGQFSGKTGKIERVNTKKTKVYITGFELTKKDGTKVLLPIHPSNVMIIELDLNDKMRKEKLEKNKKIETKKVK